MSHSIVRDKAIKFALRVVRLHKYLTEERHEFILSKQALISGTFIAKHVIEATQGESRQTFSNEMFVAKKRASETEFWLMLLHEGGFMDDRKYESINTDCVELFKMTSSIAKTTKAE
ncbi:MAG: four helix bundle protein [Acidobacteria bacterium]|nr:four helix bundle protein [Acidobacteriota bacterium]